MPDQYLDELVRQIVREEARGIVREELAAAVKPDEWLSHTQAAEMLGISVGHLHNLVAPNGKDGGRVPSHKPGGRRLYRRSELEAFIEARR